MGARFLVSRLSSLGDVACTLPVAGALKASYPDSEIVWVCDPRFASIVECCRHVDQVVRAKPGFSPKSWPILEGEFDVAFDMQGLFKSAIPVARAKAKRKLGYHWQREGAWLFSDRVLPDPSSFHIVDQYVDVARAAGAEAHVADFGLVPDPEATSSVQAKLKAAGVAERFVVINPGAAWVTKRWPAASFGAVADGLARAGVQTVLVGAKAPTDLEVAQSVIDACDAKPANLCGETNINELIALIALSGAHLGGDTGSTHLAAALGVPAVGLYSITRPQRSCPYGQIDRCHYDPDSLANISPEAVLGTLREALSVKA